MSIIGWLVLGAAAGLLANRLVPRRSPASVPASLVGGMAGAFIGGGLFSLIADRDVTGVDLLSMIIAFMGSGLLLTAIRKADYAEPPIPERMNGRPKTRLD